MHIKHINILVQKENNWVKLVSLVSPLWQIAYQNCISVRLLVHNETFTISLYAAFNLYSSICCDRSWK